MRAEPWARASTKLYSPFAFRKLWRKNQVPFAEKLGYKKFLLYMFGVIFFLYSINRRSYLTRNWEINYVYLLHSLRTIFRDNSTEVMRYRRQVLRNSFANFTRFNLYLLIYYYKVFSILLDMHLTYISVHANNMFVRLSSGTSGFPLNRFQLKL